MTVRSIVISDLNIAPPRHYKATPFLFFLIVLPYFTQLDSSHPRNLVLGAYFRNRLVETDQPYRAAWLRGDQGHSRDMPS